MRARGRVVIHGVGDGRGKILDISTGGVRFRIAGPVPKYDVGDRLDLELRFDGAKGGWWPIAGRVARLDLGEIVVGFAEVPADFETWMQVELVAALEADGVRCVLVVDSNADRRLRVADSLRAGGRSVYEVATPLEAIDRLGESGLRPRTVAVADTVPSGIADDLRAYIRDEHADVGIVRMIGGAR